MESNGERIAEIQVRQRGEDIRIKKIWKATTPGAELREEVQKGRFMAPNGDMWFLIHLNIAYDHNGKNRTILGVQEHWKILAPWERPWEEPGHFETHEIKHIVPLSGPSDVEKWDQLVQQARQALKDRGSPFPDPEALDELGRQIFRWVGKSCESQGNGGLRPECYSESAEAWARLQAQAKLEGWYGSENFKSARKE